MARPVKYGLDYWSCDVDIFDDDKVIPVTGEFGIKGQIVLVHLLCAIYRNGYFILWTERLRYSLCSKMPGISDEVLCMIVNRLVKWGFFDEHLFSSVKVLTSKAIQERYFSAVYRRKIIETDEFLLVPLPEGFCCQKPMEKSGKEGFCQHNDNNNTPAGGFLPSKTPKVNKRKGKESKENFSSSAQAQEEGPEEEKREFLEIFFFRNFRDPNRELERFLAWNGKKGTHPTRYDADLWNPEDKDKRFPEGFLKAWKELYTLAKYSGTDGEDCSCAMLDGKITMQARNGRWLLACPEIVARWLNTNQSVASDTLKPALRGFPLDLKSYKTAL